MRELEPFDKARILIRAACGEDWGDGYIVMDVASGYAEPGYGSDESVVVFGNWNPKRFARQGEPPLTKAESLAPRLGDALVEAGAEIEWYDEWHTCGECYRALRTQGDSYSWTMYGAWSEDGITCTDCMVKDPEAFLPEWINDPHKAVTWLTKAQLAGLRFEQFERDDPQQYENGWHPGQDDNPETITAEIREKLGPDVEIVFVIDGVGQFDVRFSAWTREEEE